jgi:hypothetical protein
MVPIEVFSDPMEAMRAYKPIYKESPHQEWYVFHTNRKEIHLSGRRGTGGCEGAVAFGIAAEAPRKGNKPG